MHETAAASEATSLTQIDGESLETLLTDSKVPKVSIHMKKAEAGRWSSHDRITWKHLVEEARTTLTGQGFRRRDMASLGATLRSDRFRDLEAPAGSSLVVLANPEWDVALVVPLALDPRVLVGSDYLLAPLTQLMSPQRFVVLALSESSSRAFAATEFLMQPLDIADLPNGTAGLAQWMKDERSLQFHQAGRTGRGEPAAAFHGDGSHEHLAEAIRDNYLRAIDRAVTATVDPTMPIVVVAPKHLAAHYVAVTRHRMLYTTSQPAGGDGATMADLHEVARATVARENPPHEGLQERFELLTARRRTASGLSVMSTAEAGRIETLIIDWPRVADVEAANRAACHTLRAGGDVVELTNAVGHGLAAILRY